MFTTIFKCSMCRNHTKQTELDYVGVLRRWENAACPHCGASSGYLEAIGTNRK